MSQTDAETIAVADVSDGACGDDTAAGTPVALPAVEILTGRGFVTGKSGSGKSNTASVVIENLLSNNFPVLVVDTDGEYYGLKEEFEILHAGADDECDIQVSPEHAEKIASLALEQNVPIILDVSGYLDESVGSELLLRTARQLFAKEKKLKKPFLLVVEECHEYIPEGGGLDETGKMLIKVGKRGRKHGLGVVGMSQRPADVKKDFITQCDWMVWHRLTWDNDTKVVGRILGNDYADAVEDLGDGEAFLMTDWAEDIRRVQFHRKQTFDAGATPGLEDFERPELKSVSGNLVDELRDITDEQERRESELADLRQELDRKEQRIRELQAELEEARDLKRMADKFAQAMLSKAEAPYRGGSGRNLARIEQAELDEYDPAEGEGSAEAGDGVGAPEDAEGEGSAEAGGGVGAPEDAEGEGSAEAGDGVGAPEDADGEAETPPNPVTNDVHVDATALEVGTREAVVAELRSRVESLSDISLGMLRHYRTEGVAAPVDAHVAAGGDGDREVAYGRNRPIRRAGLVRHAGIGQYRYALADLVREAYDDRLDDADVDRMVEEIEAAFLDD
jgi:hypothetical protein